MVIQFDSYSFREIFIENAVYTETTYHFTKVFYNIAVFFPFLTPLLEKLGFMLFSRKGLNFFSELMDRLIKERQQMEEVCDLFYITEKNL